MAANQIATTRWHNSVSEPAGDSARGPANRMEGPTMNAMNPKPLKVDELVTLPYPKFQKMDDLDWNPRVMDGVEYNLGSLDDRTNGFSLFLRVAPNTVAPVHLHMGSIELLMLEGDLTYDGV